MFGLPISTLRYYDKQGLFPNMERTSGIRRFSDQEIEALRVIECLKRAGMEIKDIRQFMDWCVEGPSTYPQRKAMFEEQRSHMEAELEQMNRTLDMLKFKCWYYEQAIKDGSEGRLKSLIPDHLPDGIRKAYDACGQFQNILFHVFHIGVTCVSRIQIDPFSQPFFMNPKHKKTLENTGFPRVLIFF